MAFPVVKVCVTVVGLVQSSFLCARVSSYCCNLCVCRYMWLEFYDAYSGWGILISFWSVLMFSPTSSPFYYYYLIIIVIVIVIIIDYYFYYYFHRAPGSV